MRAVVLYLTVLVLIAVSIGVGYVASDWPRLCADRHWCDQGWPHHP